MYWHILSTNQLNAETRAPTPPPPPLYNILYNDNYLSTSADYIPGANRIWAGAMRYWDITPRSYQGHSQLISRSNWQSLGKYYFFAFFNLFVPTDRHQLWA